MTTNTNEDLPEESENERRARINQRIEGLANGDHEKPKEDGVGGSQDSEEMQRVALDFGDNTEPTREIKTLGVGEKVRNTLLSSGEIAIPSKKLEEDEGLSGAVLQEQGTRVDLEPQPEFQTIREKPRQDLTLRDEKKVSIPIADKSEIEARHAEFMGWAGSMKMDVIQRNITQAEQNPNDLEFLKLAISNYKDLGLYLYWFWGNLPEPSTRSGVEITHPMKRPFLLYERLDKIIHSVVSGLEKGVEQLILVPNEKAAVFIANAGPLMAEYVETLWENLDTETQGKLATLLRLGCNSFYQKHVDNRGLAVMAQEGRGGASRGIENNFSQFVSRLEGITGETLLNLGRDR